MIVARIIKEGTYLNLMKDVRIARVGWHILICTLVSFKIITFSFTPQLTFNSHMNYTILDSENKVKFDTKNAIQTNCKVERKSAAAEAGLDGAYTLHYATERTDALFSAKLSSFFTCEM